MNNKVHKIDSSITGPALGGAAVKATYGPATAGMEYDLANGGGLALNVSAAVGRLRLQPTLTKVVTGLVDTVATVVYTVTVPNAQVNAVFELDVTGILGAGGAIGAGEAFKAAKYQLGVVRTPGVAAVTNLQGAIANAAAAANVAGATTVASTVVTVSAVAGAVGAVNTFNILVAITKTGGASALHVAACQLAFNPQQVSGITVA